MKFITQIKQIKLIKLVSQSFHPFFESIFYLGQSRLHHKIHGAGHFRSGSKVKAELQHRMLTTNNNIFN